MMHILGKIAWLVTALASIAIGSAVFGFDLWRSVPANMIQPMNIIIGIAGILSLLICFQRCMYHHQGHHHGPECNCNRSM